MNHFNHKTICMLMPAHTVGSYMITAEALIKQGFKVVLLALDNNNLTGEENKTGVVIKQLPSGGIFYSPFISILNPLLTIMFIKTALRTEACIYWGRGYVTLFILFFLKMLKRKVIYHVGDDDPSNMSMVVKKYSRLAFTKDITEKIFRAFELFVISKVDYVIALTEALKRDREGHARKIKTISYAVDAVFNKHNIDTNLKNEYAGAKVIVFSGTVALQKGFMQAMAAYELVRKSVPESILLMAGGILKCDEKQVRQAIAGRKGIVITGWLPYKQLPKYITLGKVGLALISSVNYSYKISLPFKLLEQMACGLPVIAPKGFPEIENIVRTANCGFLVDINKPEDIASSIIKIFNDPKLGFELGANAKQFIKNKHNLDLFESEIVGVFTSVLNDSNE